MVHNSLVWLLMGVNGIYTHIQPANAAGEWIALYASVCVRVNVACVDIDKTRKIYGDSQHHRSAKEIGRWWKSTSRNEMAGRTKRFNLQPQHNKDTYIVPPTTRIAKTAATNNNKNYYDIRRIIKITLRERGKAIYRSDRERTTERNKNNNKHTAKLNNLGILSIQ